MIRLSPRRLAALSTAIPVPKLCRAAGLAVLLAAGGVASAAPASAAMFGYGMSAPDIADLLYARYRVARVMRVVSSGDLFEADAIDRRGFRMHFTIDAYSGEVLDSYIMGRVAYEPAVPVPPGLVPNGSSVQPYPPAPGEENLRSEPGRARLPQRGRQARNPDAATAPAPGPKVKQVPAPKVAPAPAPAPVAPAPATASRQPPEKAPESFSPSPPQTVTPPAQVVRPVTPLEPKPTEVKPSETRPAETKPSGHRPSEARQAAPARLPEPLIDPKTGQPSGGVPVAPLDATKPDAKAPITIVPPAPLE
jgi:hypothetical protein